ncbi:MAG: TetR/AcrR family transcriptional regulator [Planctomycetes bacterium]|nr:TetR/AcrR family transcriptional regulator [Planctomycetota bacterium]
MTRKEAILKAATRLFADKGFADTSMSELSEITGVAGGTIFYHFKNKEELLIAILAEVKTGILDEFDRYSKEKSPSTGMEMLERTISFYFSLAGLHTEWFRLLDRHYPYKLAETHPVCREHLEAIYNCLVDIFEKAIQQGRDEGSMDCSSPRKSALIIFSLVDGIVRFKNKNLYDAGSLFNEVLALCCRMMQKQ